LNPTGSIEALAIAKAMRENLWLYPAVEIVHIVGFTMLVAVIDVVLITAIATLGAFLYNMAAALLGGIEVTLTEDR